MVLPAPPADDEPRQGAWLASVQLELSLTRRGLLVLIAGGGAAELRALVLALLQEHPAVEVHTDVRSILTVPEGSTLVLEPQATDADWLNIQRPAVARRGLKVILWCDASTREVLARDARDFFDWISHHHEAPIAPAPHGIRGIQAALRARAPGIVWRGWNLDRCFQEAMPGRALLWASAARPYAEMVEAVRSAGRAWVAWVEVDGPFRLRRARWALAEAGRRTRAVLVEPSVGSPGWWKVDGRALPLFFARDILESAGAQASGRLAALCGLEPDAVGLAAQLLARGATLSEVERTLIQAEDPGAALARLGEVWGLLDLELLATDDAAPPWMRAFGGDARVRALRGERIRRVDAMLRRGDAVDPTLAAWWAARAPAGDEMVHMEQQGPLTRNALTEALLRARTTAARTLTRMEADAWETIPEFDLMNEAELRKLLTYGEETLGEEHPRIAEMLLRLTRVLLLQGGRTDEAEALAQRAASILAKVYGEEHPRYAEALERLAEVRYRQRRFDDTEAILRRGIAAVEAAGGEEELLSRLLLSLADVLRVQGREADADAAGRRALALVLRNITDPPLA